MSKLDLIIDALYKVELLFESHGQYPHTLREVNEALAAARKLRELKPVAWQVMDENDALREFSIKDIAQDWITTELLRGSSIVYWIQPLYALDEVKHESLSDN
jgi:hypothetical protein